MITNVEITEVTEYRDAALLRLTNVQNIVKQRLGAKYNRELTEEAALLTQTLNILNYLSPYLYYIRQDAKTLKGFPDIIFCLNSRFVGLELKDDEGECSAQQRKQARKIVAAQGVCVELKTIAQLFKVLFGCFDVII